MEKHFTQFANATARKAGSPGAFLAAVLLILTWAPCGPFFGYSETWQLVINTGTTVITFLMVFLIQNSQNRDSKALHLKLNELLRGVHGARTELVDLEEMSDAELEKLHHEFQELHERVHAHVKRRGLHVKKHSTTR